MKPRSIKTYLAAAALLTGLLAVPCVYLANQPDQVLEFERDVPTSLPIETLSLSISTLSNWPKWFYNVAQAVREDAAGRPFPTRDQAIEKGALVRLTIQPHKGEHRGSFELLLTITDYVPGKKIEMSVIQDRSERILKLFQSLSWKIELAPDSAGSGLTIRGTELARTQHWRARLIGAVAPRILMNQLFYPDLMALGEFTQPLPLNPFPSYGQ